MRSCTFVALSFILLLSAACQSSPPQPTPTPPPTPSPVPTYTPLPTYTPFPSATPTPTLTPTATPDLEARYFAEWKPIYADHALLAQSNLILIQYKTYCQMATFHYDELRPRIAALEPPPSLSEFHKLFLQVFEGDVAVAAAIDAYCADKTKGAGSIISAVQQVLPAAENLAQEMKRLRL